MDHVAIRLPKMGESAAEAAIVAWLVEPGTAVALDQDILEVETEKSVLTVTAPAAGVLAEQLCKPGDRCQVGDLLGQIAVATGSARPLPISPSVAEPQAKTPTGAAYPVDAESVAMMAEGNGVSRTPPARAAGIGYFSPRVRGLMNEYGLSASDIAGIRGTGRAGRVSTRDIERFLDRIDSGKTSRASPMRMAVADSMRRSWTRPLATIACTLRMDPLLAHRRTVAGRPSATVYAIRALGLALAGDDRSASRLVGDRLAHPVSLDIAFAVEVEDGVRTPVIREVDKLDLSAVNQAYEKLLPDSKSGLATADAHSVATVSNYGTFGVEWATPIPLPDQSLLLGLGAVRNDPDWDPKANAWGRARVCELTLTFDHRVVDGGAAGRLLKTVTDLLQHPERL